MCDAERLSYAEADRRSAQLARGLIALGAGKGTHVGLLYPNGADFVVGDAGRGPDRRRGRAVLDVLHRAGNARTNSSHSDVEILLATASYRVTRLPASGLPSIDASRLPRLLRHVLHRRPNRDARRSTTDAARGDGSRRRRHRIRWRSSTRRVRRAPPRAWCTPTRPCSSTRANLNEIRGLTADDKLFCNSPFFWIGGFAFGLLATLVAGSTLVCSNATDAGRDAGSARGRAAHHDKRFRRGHRSPGPSPELRRPRPVVDAPRQPVPDHGARVRPADPELRHTMLGMTEAGSVVTDQRRRVRPTRTPARIVRQARAGVRDQDHRHRPSTAHGELCIRGPYVMQRYYKRSREECFDADGWFHTGDLVRTDADGFVYFIGRRGAMIKTAGANVAPAEVEKAIAKVTGGTGRARARPARSRARTAGRRGRRVGGRRRVRRGRAARATQGGAVRLQDPEADRRRAAVPRFRCCPAARST